MPVACGVYSRNRPSRIHAGGGKIVWTADGHRANGRLYERAQVALDQRRRRTVAKRPPAYPRAGQAFGIDPLVRLRVGGPDDLAAGRAESLKKMLVLATREVESFAARASVAAASLHRASKGDCAGAQCLYDANPVTIESLLVPTP